MKNDKPLLGQTKNSILTIRNTIFSEENNLTKSNQLDNFTDEYFNNCLYHPINDSFCPRFKLGDIIKFTPNARGDYEDLAGNGSVILIIIKWNCWVKGIFHDEECNFVYKFERIDENDNAKAISIGTFNNEWYYENGEKRMMMRSNRILFKIKTFVTLKSYDINKANIGFWAYGSVVIMSLIPFGYLINSIYFVGGKKTI